jgi:anti-anti-sigma factor
MLIRGGGNHPAANMGRLVVGCRIVAGRAVVEIAGPLDCATQQQVYRDLAEVIDRHGLPVIVEVSGLAECDGYGVLALARAAERAGLSGCAFWLRGRAMQVIRIMRISGSGSARLRWHRRSTLAWTDPARVVARLSSADWPPPWR